MESVFTACRLAFELNFFYLTLLAVHFSLALSNYTFKPCNFQLDHKIFIHCYFLLVLMPEPVLYICLIGDAKFALDTHFPHFASHRVKFQTQHRIFLTKLLNFCLRLIDHWSRQKKPLWGERWRPIDLLPRLFRLSCFLKKGVGRQQKTSTSSQNVACSVEMIWAQRDKALQEIIAFMDKRKSLSLLYVLKQSKQYFGLR